MQTDPAYQGGAAAQARYLKDVVPAMIRAGASKVFVSERDSLAGPFASEGVLDTTDPLPACPQYIRRPSFYALCELVKAGYSRPTTQITLESFRTKSATVTLRIKCRGVTCAGTAIITTIEKLSSNGRRIIRLTNTASRFGRSRLVTIAYGRFNAHAGNIKITIKLNTAGTRLLSKFKRIPGTLKITLTRSGTILGTTSSHITFTTDVHAKPALLRTN